MTVIDYSSFSKNTQLLFNSRILNVKRYFVNNNYKHERWSVTNIMLEEQIQINTNTHFIHV